MRAERLRIFTVVITLGMIAVVATGCGGGSEEEQPAAVEQPASQHAANLDQRTPTVAQLQHDLIHPGVTIDLEH